MPITPTADDTLDPALLSPTGLDPATVVPGVGDDIDPTAIALPGDTVAKAGSRQVINDVHVGRPGNTDWFWVYPDPAFRTTCAIYEPQVVGTAQRSRPHLVLPAVVAALGLGRGIKHVELFTYITRHGVLGLWPIGMPQDDRDNDWIDTARDAAVNFAGRWINLRSDMAARRYQLSEPVETLPDPAAPPFALGKLLGLAFRNRVVKDLDHPAIRSLLGRLS